MNYLMYYIEGFIKKFPLNKPVITIGRNRDNDLVIREDFISRSHVSIENHDSTIFVKDLQSTNGITYQGEKVMEATIPLGESFILGKIEFFLKSGNLDEFKLAEKLIPIFDIIGSDNEKKFDDAVTRYIEDIYKVTLKVVMQVGLKKTDFNDFLLDISNHLSNLSNFASLFIVSKQQKDLNISLSVRNEDFKIPLLKKIVNDNETIFREKLLLQPIPGMNDNTCFYSYPLKNLDDHTAMIFVWHKKKEKEIIKVEDFFSCLVTEFELLAQLLTHKSKKEGIPGLKEYPVEEGNIIAESIKMKELILQAKKISDSDIFVLVQGESGTGKELFARLIHNNSPRAKHKFVAINCAAIPENLLESELFGYEKGAFTGAYTQKSGKLEIASGGTLVLDEIGDMPINLQSKLLRALQEKEFYRLGASAPISVDLRIISLTHQDLKQLIIEGKFREDLYYRLVHRIITIPPLRERKEDISALINFFTQKFCKEVNKKINGYSIKAFETLQSYRWKGNVRQLENEIRSIVNLTDPGETVGYDILSDEIKSDKDEPHYLKKNNLLIIDKNNPEDEKAFILSVLEQSGWNKSKAARMLKMTYMGLHKKMKRLGISSSD